MIWSQDIEFIENFRGKEGSSGGTEQPYHQELEGVNPYPKNPEMEGETRYFRDGQRHNDDK